MNDSRKPGQDDNWTPEQMAQGETRGQIAGMDYFVSDRNRRFEVNGSMQVQHADQNVTTDQNRVNFLPQGDTYDYSRSVARNKNLGLHTSHLLDLTCGQLYLRLQPTFTYRHYDYAGSSLSATFSAMQGDAGRRWVAAEISTRRNPNWDGLQPKLRRVAVKIGTGRSFCRIVSQSIFVHLP